MDNSISLLTGVAYFERSRLIPVGFKCRDLLLLLLQGGMKNKRTDTAETKDAIKEQRTEFLKHPVLLCAMITVKNYMNNMPKYQSWWHASKISSFTPIGRRMTMDEENAIESELEKCMVRDMVRMLKEQIFVTGWEERGLDLPYFGLQAIEDGEMDSEKLQAVKKRLQDALEFK